MILLEYRMLESDFVMTSEHIEQEQCELNSRALNIMQCARTYREMGIPLEHQTQELFFIYLEATLERLKTVHCGRDVVRVIWSDKGDKTLDLMSKSTKWALKDGRIYNSDRVPKGITVTALGGPERVIGTHSNSDYKLVVQRFKVQK